jgi:hypothetical protein
VLLRKNWASKIRRQRMMVSTGLCSQGWLADGVCCWENWVLKEMSLTIIEREMKNVRDAANCKQRRRCWYWPSQLGKALPLQLFALNFNSPF